MGPTRVRNIRSLRSVADNSAFSLIELMIVVAIVALLAAVAIPTFTTYRLKAKQSEVPVIMNGIINGQKSFFIRPRLGADGRELESCYLQTGWLPSIFPSGPQGAPLIPPPQFEEQWEHLGLPAAEGTIIYHSYSSMLSTFFPMKFVPFCFLTTSEPMMFELKLRARGDLDGDGTLAVFEHEFLVDDSGAPTVGPLIRQTAPNVY